MFASSGPPSEITAIVEFITVEYPGLSEHSHTITPQNEQSVTIRQAREILRADELSKYLATRGYEFVLGGGHGKASFLTWHINKFIDVPRSSDTVQRPASPVSLDVVVNAAFTSAMDGASGSSMADICPGRHNPKAISLFIKRTMCAGFRFGVFVAEVSKKHDVDMIVKDTHADQFEIIICPRRKSTWGAVFYPTRTEDGRDSDTDEGASDTGRDDISVTPECSSVRPGQTVYSDDEDDTAQSGVALGHDPRVRRGGCTPVWWLFCSILLVVVAIVIGAVVDLVSI